MLLIVFHSFENKIIIITNEITAKIETEYITVKLVNKIFWVSNATILSAERLFKKWEKIGTKILSVFKYNKAMQIANMKAEVIEPKLWREANNNEVINIANFVGKNNFILFSITPLKINSSLIGETTTIAIKPKAKLNEWFRYIDEVEKFIRKFKLGKFTKRKSPRYKNPYDKNIFKITTNNIDLMESFENTSFKSFFKSEKEFLSLKIKYKIIITYMAVEYEEMTLNNLKAWKIANKEIMTTHNSFNVIFFNVSLIKDIITMKIFINEIWN